MRSGGYIILISFSRYKKDKKAFQTEYGISTIQLLCSSTLMCLNQIEDYRVDDLCPDDVVLDIGMQMSEPLRSLQQES